MSKAIQIDTYDNNDNRRKLDRLQRMQIERELMRLERQLERLYNISEDVDSNTLNTYQEMIDSRKEMLGKLSS